MSKQNKVNPGMYTQAGRLSPDAAARERMKQADARSTRRAEGRPPARPGTGASDTSKDADNKTEDEPTDESEE